MRRYYLYCSMILGDVQESFCRTLAVFVEVWYNENIVSCPVLLAQNRGGATRPAKAWTVLAKGLLNNCFCEKPFEKRSAVS